MEDWRQIRDRQGEGGPWGMGVWALQGAGEGDKMEEWDGRRWL